MSGCRLGKERRESDRAESIGAAQQHFAAAEWTGDEAIAVHFSRDRSIHKNEFLHVDQHVTKIIPRLYRIGILFLLFADELQSRGEFVRLWRARERSDVK